MLHWHWDSPLQWRHNERGGVSNTGFWSVCWRVTHRWPVDSPHKGPVTRKIFSFDDTQVCHSQLIFMDMGKTKPQQNTTKCSPCAYSLVYTLSKRCGFTAFMVCGLWSQKQVSRVGISNCIPLCSVGCNYLSLPEIYLLDKQNNYVKMDFRESSILQNIVWKLQNFVCRVSEYFDTLQSWIINFALDYDVPD